VQCSVFGLEAVALGKGGGQGDEQELVYEPELVLDGTCIVGRGPPERITLHTYLQMSAAHLYSIL